MIDRVNIFQLGSGFLQREQRKHEVTEVAARKLVEGQSKARCDILVSGVLSEDHEQGGGLLVEGQS